MDWTYSVPVAAPFCRGSELSGSVEGWEFLNAIS
jgi:hypothetical protein